tara:strand:+ start:1882 stop:2184 length:303 start_codon:yes stop_codon:yes gene_type:complete
MERLTLNYSINVSNDVGVQNVVDGSMFLHTANIDNETELMNRVTEAMEDVMEELQYEILGGYCKVMSGQDELFKLDFYSHETLDEEISSRWIEPTMKTIH